MYVVTSSPIVRPTRPNFGHHHHLVEVVVVAVEVVVAVVEAVVVVALPLPLPPLCTGLVVGRNGRWISSSTSRCPS